MPRYQIIANPTAGHGSIEKAIPQIEKSIADLDSATQEHLVFEMEK